MELRDFIGQYLLYSRMPVTEILKKAPFAFAMAFTNDPQCRNWYIRQRFKDLHIDVDQFCCLEFALWHLEDLTQKVRKKEIPSPEKFVIYWDDFKAFGMQHPSQKFCVPVNYCPWCGKRLPQFDYYTQYHEEEKE
ncbi:DUF6980 family protein [Taibaiella koreensis]|uniref:DUF6980 family protein n=1 Tax=Taibaiella koreensis TaxID=1268548 RepID=UPI0013C3416B|nr:hypothetical protein [Taibaiella koreensis]